MIISAPHPAAILRLAQVIKRTGLSRSTIYQRIDDGAFPQQIRLGANSVGWIETEIDEWISSRIQQSRKTASAAVHVRRRVLIPRVSASSATSCI